MYDYTFEICKALNTPQPSRFLVDQRVSESNVILMNISLLDGTREATGLAVELAEIANNKIRVIGYSYIGWTIHIKFGDLYTTIDEPSFAVAIHKALCVAFKIGKSVK